MNTHPSQLSFDDVRSEPPPPPTYASLLAALRQPGMPSTVTVPAAARLLGISRTTAYEAVRDGSLTAIRIRRRVMIPVAYLVEVLSGNGTRAKEWYDEAEPDDDDWDDLGDD